MNKEPKIHKTTLRFTAEAERIITKLMRKHGLNRTAVIEMALRQLDREDADPTTVR